MMKKKILYIDMDGVIADFDMGIEKLNPEIKKFESLIIIDIIKDSICQFNQEIFHTLPPIDGAIESIKELMNSYDVYFVSTGMWNVPISFTGKRIWIEKHFGELATKRLILTHRKDLMIGDYLVDNLLNYGSANFKGRLIHFGTEEFPDWKVTYEYFDKELRD